MTRDRPGGAECGPGDRCRRTAVLDLDGTIVAGDASGALLSHLITRHRVRRVVVLLTAPAWWPALSIPPVRLAAERYLAWLAAAGMDEEALVTAARGFAAQHAGPEGGRMSAAAVARARQHLTDGDRVVDPTARDLARLRRALGEDVEVLLWAGHPRTTP